MICSFLDASKKRFNFSNRIVFALIFLATLAIFGMNPSAVSAQSPMQYTVSFTDAPRHLVDVELVLASDGRDQIELMMPVWTPGSYLIREYARHVESISATSVADGKALQINKTVKNRWMVNTKGVSEIAVRYRLYCREMSVRTNWVEKSWGVLTGAATFIARVDALPAPHRVRLVLPSDWPDVATSLKQTRSNGQVVLEASNFDELVDSPIAMGNLDIVTFDVGGKPHHLVNIGDDRLWDLKTAQADVSKIIAKQQAMWGEVPYSDYWFLNVLGETGGGLEHDNSCLLMASRWTQKKRESYVNWLGLVSHEFFHAWNVRRLRPAELKNYDYEQEQYFPELWIAEGITSYYDDLFVCRSGLVSRDEYLQRLGKAISGLQTTQGRLVQPLVDSSFDTWIKHYRPDENASNSRISYYVKGAIVGMVVDAELRRLTDGRSSLDDVMRTLWKEKLATGYTISDFQQVASRFAGKDLGPWLAPMLDSTQELPLDEALKVYGLRFKKQEKKPDAKPAELWLGADTTATEGRLTVSRLTRNSPADEAGINVDDELIAIDGYRLSATTLADRISGYQSGDEAELLISRRGKLQTLKVRLREKPDSSFAIEVDPESTEAQKNQLNSWLHIEPKPEKPADSAAQTPPAKTP